MVFPRPGHSPTLVSRRDALRTVALTLGAATVPTLFSAARLGAEEAKPTPAATPAAAPPTLKTISLGEGLSLITGAGGNVAVLTGQDGTLVVDCGVPASIVGLQAEIAKLAPAAISTLLNTHWHFDHTGGNEAFARTGARIVAHENCRQRLSTDQFIEFFEMKLPASPRTAWPTTTFTNDLVLHANGERLHLTTVPPAHTDGDVIVHLTKANVLHLGDLFFHTNYPFIDYSSGGWIGGMAAAAKTALALCDAKTRIIPGHGPLATRDDLAGYLAFLETMSERLTKLKTQGKSVAEAVAALPTKDFDEKLGKGFLTPDKFVQCTYAGLLKHS